MIGLITFDFHCGNFTHDEIIVMICSDNNDKYIVEGNSQWPLFL